MNFIRSLGEDAGMVPSGGRSEEVLVSELLRGTG